MYHVTVIILRFYEKDNENEGGKYSHTSGLLFHSNLMHLGDVLSNTALHRTQVVKR